MNKAKHVRAAVRRNRNDNLKHRSKHPGRPTPRRAHAKTSQPKVGRPAPHPEILGARQERAAGRNAPAPAAVDLSAGLPVQRPIIIRGYDGLTTDGVYAKIERARPQFPIARIEMIDSLPVSPEVCARFSQGEHYIDRLVDQLEATTSKRFQVEASFGGITRVWRVA